MKPYERQQTVFLDGMERLQVRMRSRNIFIGHRFYGGNIHEMEHYRSFLRTPLSEQAYTALFPDEDEKPGTLTAAICRQIIECDGSIFDMSGFNANVLLELGVALGFNQVVLPIVHAEDVLPAELNELQPFCYNSYIALATQIGGALVSRFDVFGKQSPNYLYCSACQQDCACRRQPYSDIKTFALIGHNKTEEEEAELAYYVERIAKGLGYHLLGETSFPGNYGICRAIARLKRAKFALFWLKTPYNSPTLAFTFLQLGLAIGLGIPWKIITDGRNEVPADVRGFGRMTFDRDHINTFENLLTKSIVNLLAEWGNSGVFTPLDATTGDELFETEPDIVLLPSTFVPRYLR